MSSTLHCICYTIILGMLFRYTIHCSEAKLVFLLGKTPNYILLIAPKSINQWMKSPHFCCNVTIQGPVNCIYKAIKINKQMNQTRYFQYSAAAKVIFLSLDIWGSSGLLWQQESWDTNSLHRGLVSSPSSAVLPVTRGEEVNIYSPQREKRGL